MDKEHIILLIERMEDRYIMQNEFNIISTLELSCYLECLDDLKEIICDDWE